MDSFRKEMTTKRGHSISIILDVVLIYLFASISIDTASMFAYFATIFFIGSAVYHIVSLFKLSQKPVNKRAHAKR